MTTENSSGDDSGAHRPEAATPKAEPKPPTVKSAPIIRGETEAVVGGAGAPSRKDRDDA